MYGSDDFSLFEGKGCGYVVPSFNTIWSKQEIKKENNIYENHFRLTEPNREDTYKEYNKLYMTSVTSSLHDDMNYDPAKEQKYHPTPLNRMIAGNHGKNIHIETDFHNTRIIDELSGHKIKEPELHYSVKKNHGHRLQQV